ncbi:carbohydrate deacetylase [Candidatus Omnitrophota bacterium]
MKVLIVNADDVGLSSAINEAVKRCCQDGVVTGVSVMPCGEQFSEGVEMLREIGKTEAGVHLTLTGNFKPCIENRSLIISLVKKNGYFVSSYKSFATRYFLGKLITGDIYTELERQIKKVREAGLKITHLDSHEHVHMFPGVLKAVIRLAWKFEIPYIRLPKENLGIVKERFATKDLVRYAGLKMFTTSAEKTLSRSGIKHNDVFWGHFHSGRLDSGILCFMANNVTEGINELAVHPGIFSPELLEEFPWYRNAENEMEALLKGRWKGLLEARGGRLISHAEALDLEL